MPIKIKELINKKIPKKSLNVRIVNFLQKNNELAYTQKELRSKFKLTPSNLSARLSQLKKQGKIMNKDGYWFYKPQINRTGTGTRKSRYEKK